MFCLASIVEHVTLIEDFPIFLTFNHVIFWYEMTGGRADEQSTGQDTASASAQSVGQ